MYNWITHKKEFYFLKFSNVYLGEGNGTPLQYSCLENPMDRGAHHEESDTTEQLNFPFPFHALEKEMATHSSVLDWRIPGTGEPGGLPSMGSHRVRHDWSDLAAELIRVDTWQKPTQYCKTINLQLKINLNFKKADYNYIGHQLKQKSLHVMVSAIQQCKSVITTYISPPSWVSLPPLPTPPFWSSRSTKLGSLVCRAASHQLSISHMVVYICQCSSLSSSHRLPPTPLCPQKRPLWLEQKDSFLTGGTAAKL